VRDLALTAQTVSTLARVALEGVVVGTWIEPSGQERDIRMELPTEVRSSSDAIQSLPLVQRQGFPVRVRQVASVATVGCWRSTRR
jgi:Cu/Ag efflux pump CusA